MLSSPHRFFTTFTLLFALALVFTQTATINDARAEGWTDQIRGLVNGVKKKFCTDDRVAAPISPAAVTPLPSIITSDTASDKFKSEGELHRYLECYVTESGRFKEKVEKEYLPIISAAAKSFNIPSTLLACLIFRESRFDVNARSGSGAIGLGQHLVGTMKHITDILRPSKESDTQKLLEIVNTPISERIADKKVTASMAQKDLNFAKTVLRDREFRLKWEEHFKNQNEKKCRSESRKQPEPPKASAKSKKASKNTQPRKPVQAESTEQRYERCLEKSIPRVVSTANIKDPKIAIAASAMYLQMILVDFQRALDTDIRTEQSDKQSPNYDLLLAAAGAYNMGPGAAIGILEPIEPPDRKKWVEALMRSNEETAGHVASIRNCIESSSSKRGNAFQAPIGSHNYECNDGNASNDPRTVIGKSELPNEYQNRIKSADMRPAAKAAAKATAKQLSKAESKKAELKAKPKATTKPKNSSKPGK